MNTDNFGWKEILALTAAGGALYFIVRPSGDKAESKEEGKQDLLALSQKTQYAFSEDFYGKMLSQEGYKKVEDYIKKYGLTVSQVNSYAESIYNAKGVFDDDEDALYSVFRIMKTITICSIVSKSFRIKYNKSLYSFLSEFLNTDELSRIVEIINKKYFL